MSQVKIESEATLSQKTINIGDAPLEIIDLEEELSQARKLIAELVKMGKFYADKNNYAGRRSKSDIFSNIIGDNTIYPDRTAFGGRYARDVLSNNKDIIEKLTKE